MNNSIQNPYLEIKNLLENAKEKTYYKINSIMVQTYHKIGQIIVENEQEGKSRAEYGKSLIKELSIKLTKEFGKGFSERNLRQIRRFYLIFPKWHAVRAKLSWTHYSEILRIEDELKKHILQETQELYQRMEVAQ